MLQFWCADGYEDKEERKDMVKVEAISIYVYESSGDGDVVRVAFINIWVKDNT